MVPQPRHPARGIEQAVAMPDLVFFGRELVVLVVVEHRELGQDHGAVLVADVAHKRGGGWVWVRKEFMLISRASVTR